MPNIRTFGGGRREQSIEERRFRPIRHTGIFVRMCISDYMQEVVRKAFVDQLLIKAAALLLH